MEGKLRQLMKHEGINSTRLAEMLGIQASGISHIMSGRNKPSFDFLLKLLQRFPQINPDWLILDKGPMYRDGIKNKNGHPSPIDGDMNIGGGTHGGTGGGAAGGVGGVRVGGRSTDDMAVPYNSGGNADAGRGNVGENIRSGGLFGPDNNDIIPSGRSAERQTAGQSAERQTTRQTVGREMQYPEYKSNGFMQSASIERIVVFYKDKTFSEYQPGQA